MSVLRNRGKSDCKAIIIATGDLGKSLCRVQFFGLFNIFKVIKQLKMTLKKLYSWPKKLYQFISNTCFLTIIPTLGQLQQQVQKNFTSSYFHSWSTGFRERYLPLILHSWICIPLHADNAWKNMSVVSCSHCLER